MGLDGRMKACCVVWGMTLLLGCMEWVTCVPAWDHVQTEKPSEGQEVPYYHFPMLNDYTRNNAYYEGLKWAFAKKQDEGIRNLVVMDLGAGFMLLSMMAAELGAKEVIAIERNQIVAQVGQQIIQRNRFQKKIQVLIEDSSFLTKNDIPTIPDILVSETLDSWIIGEAFITKLIDLKHRQLISKDTLIVPSRGKLYMQLVQSAYSLPVNGSVHHFNFDPLFALKPFTHMVLREQNVQVNLSEPFEAFQFDFQSYFPSSDPHDHILYPYPNGIFDIRRFNIPVTASGMLHGAVFWFDVSMDAEETIHLLNAPHSDTHWRPMLCLFGEDYPVNQGDEVHLEVARLSERFTFAFDRIVTPANNRNNNNDDDLVVSNNTGKHSDRSHYIAPRQRHIMVYHHPCAHNQEYEIFVPRHAKQRQPVDDDFVLRHSQENEFNVIVVSVGQIIRAVQTETLQYIDYPVPDEDEQISSYGDGFTQIPVFYVGDCVSDVNEDL